RRTLWALAASLAVAGGIAAALAHIGSPRKLRLERLDAQRVEALQALDRDIRSHLQRENELPDSFAGLAGQPWARPVRVDPESHELFGYEVTGPRAFRLCAEFALASPPQPADRKPDFWTHPAGRHCYEFEVDEGRDEK